jgi:hypothetical protein
MLLEEIKSIKSTKKDLRNFGLSVGVVLLIIASVMFYYGKTTYPYFIYPAAALIILGVTIPQVLKPLQVPWMILATLMGWVMTRVILTLLFYVGITPIRFIARIFGKEFLDKKWRTSSSTNWNYRKPKEFNKEDYERQF